MSANASRAGYGTGYVPTWQELAEQEEREKVPPQWRMPPWQQLVAEGVHARAAFIANPDAFARLYAPGRHGRTFGTIVTPPPEAFTITNAQHFQFLRSVERMKQEAVAAAKRAASLGISPAMVFAARAMGANEPSLLSDSAAMNIEESVRAEQAHLIYHKAMWRAHGRRVLVLDPTTYTLLAHTDLPQFPARILASPWASFYIQLPPRAFEFEVFDVRTRTIDKRYAEGIAVGLDHPEPEYDGPRELSFMVMGEDEGMGSEGRNCAFAGVRFGPDATLDQFELNDGLARNNQHNQHNQRERIDPFASAGVLATMPAAYAESGYAGSHELRIDVPRVILGLLLYLASEHPDVVPVPPIERRTFTDIRSPLQRQRALDNQARKLKGTTRLPVLVIGSRLDEHARTFRARLDEEAQRTGKRWTLDRQVPVRGHWRNQPYGPGRMERRVKWIRPFWRGPDAAESMVIKAARIPRAQLNPEPR